MDLTDFQKAETDLEEISRWAHAQWRRIPERYGTRIAVMDLSETYRAICKKYFPNAAIVADRFHVIRLVNHHFLKAWQLLHPVGRKNRGLLSLMRRHEKNLKPEQKIKPAGYLQINKSCIEGGL